jgi:N-succinyldiaminopimelate aminotransferase
MIVDPFERLNALIEKNYSGDPKKLIPLHIGDPKGDANLDVLEFLRGRTDFNAYPPLKTSPGLADSIRFYNEEVHGVKLRNDQIAAVQGTKSAIAWLPVVFSNIRKRIGVPNIAYPGYVTAPERLGIGLEFYSFDQEILPTKPLDYLIINSPHNPSGRVLSKEELRRLAFRAKKGEFVVIADECYIDIYRGEKPTSLLKLDFTKEFKNMLVLNSLSKSSNLAGLRSGYIAGDAELVKKFAKVYATTGNALAKSVQEASSLAWKNLGFIAENRERYVQVLNDFAGKTGLMPPRSTFYFFVDTRRDGEAWTMDLIKKHGIKVMPVKYLDFANSGQWDNFVRIPVAEKLEERTIRAFKDMLH